MRRWWSFINWWDRSNVIRDKITGGLNTDQPQPRTQSGDRNISGWPELTGEWGSHEQNTMEASHSWDSRLLWAGDSISPDQHRDRRREYNPHTDIPLLPEESRRGEQERLTRLVSQLPVVCEIVQLWAGLACQAGPWEPEWGMLVWHSDLRLCFHSHDYTLQSPTSRLISLNRSTSWCSRVQYCTGQYSTVQYCTSLGGLNYLYTGSLTRLCLVMRILLSSKNQTISSDKLKRYIFREIVCVFRGARKHK